MATDLPAPGRVRCALCGRTTGLHDHSPATGWIIGPGGLTYHKRCLIDQRAKKKPPPKRGQMPLFVEG